mmetsp:Transcript_22009/g.61581  ORF Transcript_22009/g.61581 Transcript_22009/m.61581 type:complete len:391 (+) Transcript_22009:940-2112(+)
MRVLAQRRPPPEDGVGVAAGVPREGLKHLHRVVGEVVVHQVVHARAVARRVVPVALEAQYPAVVLQVLLKLGISSVATVGKLVVLLALRDVAAQRQLHLRGGLELACCEGIHRRPFVGANIHTQYALVEGSRELVATCDPENSAVNADVNAVPQVLHSIGAPAGLRDAVPLHEGSLRYAGVFDLGLSDHHRSILEVEINHAVPLPVIFLRVLLHSLLEVCSETQHLSVVLQPSRRNARAVRVPGGFALRLPLGMRQRPGAVVEAMGRVRQGLQDGQVQLRHVLRLRRVILWQPHGVCGAARPIHQALALVVRGFEAIGLEARQEWHRDVGPGGSRRASGDPHQIQRHGLVSRNAPAPTISGAQLQRDGVARKEPLPPHPADMAAFDKCWL